MSYFAAKGAALETLSSSTANVLICRGEGGYARPVHPVNRPAKYREAGSWIWRRQVVGDEAVVPILEEGTLATPPGEP